MKGTSEKFKRIGIEINLRLSSLLNTLLGAHSWNPGRKETAQCVCSIFCECGRSNIGETGRFLAVRLHEYEKNIKEGLLEK
jgi:hypothetical protein